ncbi:MAG: lamin tail domain-containing protein, partial [Myxococcota bacterium]
AARNPGATERWYDGVDQDCDDNDDDQDYDGYERDRDCDDTNAAVSPLGTEARNGVDDDCDDLCDEGVMVAGELVITEIMKNPNTPLDDTYAEWFEVYNASDTLITMCGWEIADDDGESIFMTSDVAVLPGEYAVFVRDSSTTRNGGITPDYFYNINGLYQLGNTGDEVVLYNDGTEIDRVNYTTSFPNLPGYSLTLNPLRISGTSNDTASNWCSASSSYATGNYGTPGAANDACPG